MKHQDKRKDNSAKSQHNLMALGSALILDENLDAHNKNNANHNLSNIINNFINSHDIDADSLLSSEEIDIDETIFSLIDTNSDEKLSTKEIEKKLISLHNSFQEGEISVEEYQEFASNFDLDIDTLEYTLTTEGYEFTIDENYDSSDYIYVTLDDTSSDQDSAIINLTQEDGVDQTINILDIEGIEDVTLNVIDDILNTTDDLILIDKLIINDTQTLNIHSQESIEINNIISDSLETIDLSALEGGFDIGNIETSNGITFKISNIGDGLSKIDDTEEVDTTSSIELNKGVSDIVQFSSTSLDETLLIKNTEIGEENPSDLFDFSFLGISSIDELTFIDSSNDENHGFNTLEITSDYFDGTLLLSGVTSSDIDANDFIFAS